ncbi:MAG: carboxypeptidase-like regulatory domain-containing protein [Bacteroidales bacterium]
MTHRLLAILFAILSLSLFSQEFSISGKVVDASSGEVLPFVNIVINDGKRGGTTDIDGKFSFRSKHPIVSISLSYIGYETQQYLIKSGDSEVTVKMIKTEYKLPEYVVFPTANPAHRIIKNAVKYRDYNDPEKLPAFSYTSYDKMIFTFEMDSLLMLDTIVADTSRRI